MPYNPDVRRQALAGSAIGLRDGGQSEDDWSQKQLNELDWEARQALHSGVLTPKQYEQLQRTRDGIGPNFIQKYLLGQWGEDNPATGSALDTIGSILDTASLSTHFGSLTKAALEADSDPDLFTPGELIRHPEHLADHWTNALIFTAPGFAWHTGKGLASWFDNYRNAQSMARVADEVDLWDSMAELGIYRPIGPKTFANPLPSLVPGMGAASVVGSATDALGLTEEGATLGGRIKPVLTQAAEAASGIAQASNAGGALDTAFRAVAAATSGNDEQPFLARMADPTLPSLYEAGKSPATQAVDLARTAADLTQLPTTGQEAIDPHIADVNAWLRQQKRDFIGNDRDGYFLTPTERFIGQWTLDAALDPTTYLTFGLAPGARLSVKLAKNGTFRMGDQVVQLATAPRKGKVTLTKQGTHLFRMALADFVNESINGWIFALSGYSALWLAPGPTALRTLVGWNVEIMFMFAISGIIYAHTLSGDPKARILGVREPWFWAAVYSAFCVLVELVLNAGGLLVWEYAFWTSSFAGVWLIFLLGYFHFYVATLLVIEARRLRTKLVAIAVIYAIAIALNVIGLGLLGWNY